MNFRDLEYLVAVARLSHFGKAAAECNVSQSALSLQLQKLEREVGVQLLERTTRQVVVTKAGQEVVQRARELLQGRRELLDAGRFAAGGLPETVRIGAIPTVAPFVIPGLQRACRHKYPHTSLRFEEEVTDRLVPAIARGEVEVGLLATPTEDTLLEELDLFEDPFLLAVPTGHRLAKQRRASPKDLESDQLLLLKDAHCLHAQVEGFCTAQRVAGPRQSAAASIATLLALVRSGAGITLIPQLAAGSPPDLHGIRLLPIAPSPTRRIRAVFRKTSQLGRRLAATLQDNLMK